MDYYFYRLLNLLFSNLLSFRRAEIKLTKILTESPKPSILFICSGNICRSPYGECYIKSINMHNLDIKSAGLHTTNGLKANIEAIAVAEKNNIDMSLHKTTALTEELLKNYDIILFMEPAHIAKAILKFPVLSNFSKYILLGQLAEGTLRTNLISDPYGLGQDVFNKTFTTIESACKNLIEIITNNKREQ
jgi:protein-tyrosine-phosphatase